MEQIQVRKPRHRSRRASAQPAAGCGLLMRQGTERERIHKAVLVEDVPSCKFVISRDSDPNAEGDPVFDSLDPK